MGAKHNKCCCETLPSCIIEQDDFNRADSSSLGSKWVEKSGNWAISSNTLLEVSPGIVLTTARQTKPVGTLYNYNIEVDMLTGSVSSWGIICKYTDDNNFDWIDLTLDGSQLWPTFYRRAGGSDSVVMDKTTHPSGSSFSDVDQTLLICYSETEWSINYLGGDLSAAWTTCDVSPSSTLPGDTSVGLVGFLKGHFDNFVYNYHRLSNPPCNICDCFCQNPDVFSDYSCWPERLLLTLNPTAIFPECTSSPEPIEFILYQVEAAPVATVPTSYATAKQRWWSLDLHLPDWEDDIRFEFLCNGTGGLPELNLYGGSGLSIYWNALTLGVPPSVQDCNPLYLEFQSLNCGLKQTSFEGPYICDPLSAAEYEAIITEAP
jgi:hypothetical protein